MAIKRITPVEAAQLMSQGWIYVDVRSTEEFANGHPTGAYHVPLLEAGVPNPEFLSVMGRCFAQDAPLIMGCRSGNRSLRAARMLEAEGFTRVLDMRAGLIGERDPATQELLCAGWEARGLPMAKSPEPGRSYAEIKEWDEPIG